MIPRKGDSLLRGVFIGAMIGAQLRWANITGRTALFMISGLFAVWCVYELLQGAIFRYYVRNLHDDLEDTRRHRGY